MMSPMIIVATLEEGVDNHHCHCRRSSLRMSPFIMAVVAAAVVNIGHVAAVAAVNIGHRLGHCHR